MIKQVINDNIQSSGLQGKAYLINAIASISASLQEKSHLLNGHNDEMTG